MSKAYLRCSVEVAAGSLALHAGFDLHAPWTCLFGASGSGKTTILRALAGFVRPTAGSIHLADGRILFDGAKHIFLPPHRRPVRIALQQAWLFPGSVRDNIRYGIQSGHPAQAEEEIFSRFDLAPLAKADVRSLSGGQRQRVSLARTVASALFAREPIALILLDEPFAGFDLERRNRLAPDLRDWLRERNFPVLSVTHDVPETLLLEAETMRLHDGLIVAQGPATEVLSSEINLLRSQLETRN